MKKSALRANPEHAKKIVERLKARWPEAKCTLDYANPLELLVATILSAQCTDERVNKITPALFKKYKKADDYALAKQEVFEQEIKSAGFYKNKTKHIISACKTIGEKYGGKVPDTMEDLITLSGVARKTANVMLGTAFKKAEGITVDTHVKRLAGRLGLSEETDPEKIEKDLMRIIPREDWIKTGHLLILHGRYVCKARKPLCEECDLNDICPSSGASA